MRALIIVTLTSFAFGVVSNYKMQVQAKIKLNKDFLQNYLRNSKPTSVHFDIEVPPGLAGLLDPDNGKAYLRVNNPDEDKESWSRDIKVVPKLINYLTQNSAKRYISIIIFIFNKSNINKIVTNSKPNINATINNYITKLKLYVDNLLKYKPDNQIETDVLLLDIVQTSNRFLYEETVQSLQDIMENESKVPKVNLDEIFSQHIPKKKEDFQFICKMIKLCRVFPGFSDYLADFFGELNRLPENKMHTLIMKTILAYKGKSSDINLLLGEHLVNKLDKLLQNVIYEDLSIMNKALSKTRKDIFERYKVKTISDRKRAFRLLLDMSDKAFDIDGSNEVTKHFNLITKALRGWVAGETINMQGVIKKFLDYIIDTLNARWVNDINKEARALLQIIVDGKPNHDKYKYILSNGSNFVNND